MTRVGRYKRPSKPTGAHGPKEWPPLDTQFDRRGQMNVYICDDCAGWTITVDVDPGVTPMFLACRAPTARIGGCQGRAVSSGYRVDQDLTPVWEWYRPTPTRARRMGPEMYMHVAQGGLTLRPVAA